ncbi:tRNA nuclease WapA [Pelomyxa schiedti]|nr:tRNA nuclease WapA [Pelomyxa schiedti]
MRSSAIVVSVVSCVVVLSLVVVGASSVTISSGDGLFLEFAASPSVEVQSMTIDGTKVGTKQSSTGFSFFAYGEGLEDGGTNMVTNPSFETPNGATEATDWDAFSSGYSRVTDVFHSGSASIKITSSSESEEHGASQTINPSGNFDTLKASAWSKSVNVTGDQDSDYSLYIDITYEDDTNLWGQTVDFYVGTHDWQYGETIIQLEKKVKTLNLYMLFRNSHTGTVWFDDITIVQISSTPFTNGTIQTISPNEVAISSELSAPYSMQLEAKFLAAPTHIRIDGTVKSTNTADRAVSLTFSVPLDANGWNWGTGENVLYLANSSAVSQSFDADNYPLNIDYFPFAAACGESVGVALGHAQNYIYSFRVEYRDLQKVMRITADFGLSSKSSIFPNSANFSFVLFKVDNPLWVWRAALVKYTEKILPDPYTTRVVTDQGIWMPFSQISVIENWQDFGFKFYEGSEEPAFMNANNIMNFPYVEPALGHVSLPEGTPLDTAHVMEAVLNCSDNASPSDATECKTVETSGLYDSSGNTIWVPEQEDWNTGAKFPLDCNINVPTTARADINRGQYLLSSAQAMYSSAVSGGYNITGVYIDSMETYRTTLNYRDDHLAVSQSPLLFDSSFKPAIFTAHSTLDGLSALADWMRTNHPESLMMANSVYEIFPQFATVIDVAGIEKTWLTGSVYASESPSELFQFRAMSYQKPYLLLQNSDFTIWTYDMTEMYMYACLMWGIWPGFFSANAATACYFEDPALYNRDRDLFKKFIPLLSMINKKGWKPITLATASPSGTLIERWGSGLPVYWTVRTTASVKTSITLQPDWDSLGISDMGAVTLYDDAGAAIGLGLVGNSINFSLNPETTALIRAEYSPAGSLSTSVASPSGSTPTSHSHFSSISNSISHSTSFSESGSHTSQSHSVSHSNSNSESHSSGESVSDNNSHSTASSPSGIQSGSSSKSHSTSNSHSGSQSGSNSNSNSGSTSHSHSTSTSTSTSHSTSNSQSTVSHSQSQPTSGSAHSSTSSSEPSSQEDSQLSVSVSRASTTLCDVSLAIMFLVILLL